MLILNQSSCLYSANQLTFSRDMKCIYTQIITEIVCWALSTGRTLITKTHDCAWTHSVQMQWEHWSRAATVLSTYVYITVSALEKGLVAFLILIQGEKKQKQPLACLHAIKPITIILGEDEPRMQRWRPCKALWSGLHVERRGDVQVGEWKHTHTLKTVSSEAISLMNNSEQINWIKTQLVEPCCTKCVWARSMGLTIYSARLLKQTEEGGRGERRRRWAAVRIWSLNSPKSLKYFSTCFTNLNRKYIIYLLRNCTAITNDFETNQPNCLHLQTASYRRVNVFI